MTAPLSVFRPHDSTPLVYDSPHSGRYYPDLWNALATIDQLRLGEDAYVDELLRSSVDAGATLLTNNYPRCYIDVNREERDIDPELLAAEWPEPLSPTEKTKRGLGLIRRFVIPGVAVNRDRLSVDDVQTRIRNIYRPYHDALSALLSETLRTHGRVRHINWHSMKSTGNAMTPDGPGAARPDFVVSDGYGKTASKGFTDIIVDMLRDRGFRVSVNEPYSGGTIVKRYGKPDAGIDSVQIEINRALYLDEATVTRSDRFNALEAEISQLTSGLIDNER